MEATVVVKRRAKPLLIAIISLAIILMIGIISIIVTWNIMISPVDKNNEKEINLIRVF